MLETKVKTLLYVVVGLDNLGMMRATLSMDL